MIRGERKVSFTRISESFDDSKHVVDRPADQHVVHLHSDVLAASQSVGQRTEAAFKTTACIWFRTTDFPREDRDRQQRNILPLWPHFPVYSANLANLFTLRGSQKKIKNFKNSRK